MKKYLFRLSVLIIPSIFAYLGVFYQDSLYFGISTVSFLASLLIIFPAFLSKNTLKLPDVKKISLNIKRIKIDNKKKINIFKFSELELKIAIILTFLYTALFSYISIFVLKNYVSKSNIFFSYFLNQYYFLSSIRVLLAIVLITIIVVLLGVLNRSKKIIRNELPRKVLILLGITTGTFLIGVSLALVATFVAATLQLNYPSISSIIDFKNSRYITDKQELIDKLKSMDKAPAIIPYSSSQKNKLLMALVNPSLKENGFYLKAVIPNIPSFLVLPLQVPNKSLFMIGNILVVKSINPSDIEPISPYIGYLLVKNYFNSRFIKSYPSVKVMGRQEYLDYRIKTINERVKEIEGIIQDIKSDLSSYYGSIQKAKNNIATLQRNIQDSIQKKDSEYKDCTSAGYYSAYFGTFYKYYTEGYCRGLGAKWDNYINEANGAINTNNQNVSYYQTQVNLWNEYLDGFESARDYVEDTKNQTPQELGLFEGEDNSIKIAIDETSSNVIVDYFATLSHEYLHYTSYISKDKELKYGFFEEGLTETFARKVVKKEFSIDTHIGYPVLVAIMTEMMKKIPQKTLEDIYFTKDESSLEAVLINAYGEKFYSDFGRYFDIIGYLPARDSLSLANAIITRIKGKSISESDLYSSGDTPNQ